MGDFTYFFGAMADSAKAAMVGLNLVPVLVLGLFVGMATRRGFSWAKAPAAVVPAIFVAALWPLMYGADAIWPDFSQIEAQIQTAVLLTLAWGIIASVGLAKALLAPLKMPRPVIIPLVSET